VAKVWSVVWELLAVGRTVGVHVVECHGQNTLGYNCTWYSEYIVLRIPVLYYEYSTRVLQ
jgi:hypothetical protein